MLEGFAPKRQTVEGIDIAFAIGGSGPPLLLLHGFPQSRIMWRKVAPRLAERYTLVIPDLRGYGESAKPASDPEHLPYSKRVMAQDQAALMTALGYQRFMVAGHDRGARVAHRLAKDHAARVQKVAVLDIVPTRHVFERIDQRVATAYYHWFFLIQPFDFPERMIGADPDHFLRWTIGKWGRSADAVGEEAMAEYVRHFRDPACIHAACEDYRAGASIDLSDDAADAAIKVGCPLLALWGADSLVGRAYDVGAVWREYASDVSVASVPGGHFVPEESPDETVEAFATFFG